MQWCSGSDTPRREYLCEIVQQHASFEVFQHEYPLLWCLVHFETPDDILVLQLAQVRALALQDSYVLVLEARFVQIHNLQGVVLVGLLVPSQDNLQRVEAVAGPRVCSATVQTGGRSVRERTSAKAPLPSVLIIT